jgi:hypothetical protein
MTDNHLKRAGPRQHALTSGSERRSRESGNSYWADRLGEPGLTAALSIEAGPPFVGPALGLGGAAAVLLLLGIFGVPESPVSLAGWIIFLPSSILAGGYLVRRAVGTRWTEAIGGPPPMSMLLGVVADRLVIWRRPRRGNPPPCRLVDELLAAVTLRPRPAMLGGLEIELPSGQRVYVSHEIGPHERQAIALILDAVAGAHDGAEGQARREG